MGLIYCERCSPEAHYRTNQPACFRDVHNDYPLAAEHVPFVKLRCLSTYVQHVSKNDCPQSRTHLLYFLSAFVDRSSGQIWLLQYLMSGLISLDEPCSEHSLTPTDDRARFWRSRSQQAIKVVKATMMTLATVHLIVFVTNKMRMVNRH